jgi:hypothetical protein
MGGTAGIAKLVGNALTDAGFQVDVLPAPEVANLGPYDAVVAVSVRWVRPRRTDPATWSHHLDPESLAGLAKGLYGAVPPIVLVSVAAGSFTAGDRLSAALERALPEVVELVADVVTGQRA